MDPNTLTKAQIRDELVNGNITPPPLEAKKDVFVQMYVKHFLDNRVINGVNGNNSQKEVLRLDSFSSDEDELQQSHRQRKKKLGRLTKTKKDSMTQQVMDVTDLSDEELFQALSSHGIDVGLISDTTRRIYQNKLRRLLSPEVNDEQSHVNGNSDDGPFSDEDVNEDEEDEDVNEDVEDEAFKGNEVLEEIIQQKVNGIKVIEKEEIPVPKIEPTVTRRKPAVNTDSIASNSFDVKSKETVKISSVKINTQKSADVRESSKSINTGSSRTEAVPKRNGMAIWLQMLILIAVAAVIYLIIANMEPAYTRQQLDS